MSKHATAIKCQCTKCDKFTIVPSVLLAIEVGWKVIESQEGEDEFSKYTKLYFECPFHIPESKFKAGEVWAQPNNPDIKALVYYTENILVDNTKIISVIYGGLDAYSRKHIGLNQRNSESRFEEIYTIKVEK